MRRRRSTNWGCAQCRSDGASARSYSGMALPIRQRTFLDTLGSRPGTPGPKWRWKGLCGRRQRHKLSSVAEDQPRFRTGLCGSVMDNRYFVGHYAH